MRDDIYADPAFYDAIAPDDPAMAAFYTEGLGAGQPVLELACGTGRFTLPLAASGADVVGGDADPGMLEAARRRLSGAGQAAQLLCLDMRDFDLGRRFDRIVITANGLLHLLDTADLLACLAAVRRHLSADGEFRFDIFVPSAALLSMPPGTRQPLGAGSFPSPLGPLTIAESIRYDPVRQLSTATWYWSLPGRPDFRITELVLRQIYPQELPLLLDKAGLSLTGRFGGFAREPFGTGFRQVCIATSA